MRQLPTRTRKVFSAQVVGGSEGIVEMVTIGSLKNPFKGG